MRIKRFAAKTYAILTGLAIAGVSLLPAVPVSASSYHCGSQCNNRPPSWVIPSSGIRCSDSARRIATGHPRGDTYESVGIRATDGGPLTETDSNLTVKTYYSTTCRTLWAVVSSTSAAYRSSCVTTLHRTLSPRWNSPNYGCPAANRSITTNMVDDYSSTGGIAANVYSREYLMRHVCQRPAGPSEHCGEVSFEPVIFSYLKTY